ncbi:SDR family oxidoreductase [Roseomonas sp. HJA6]|uniref:SDR family oxidoreductase n=1 Tax=Roseomonas alba TaxID=2846776 RepID=A0ABS7ADT5_9PROT|nr:SDR family oxidoreductase [Neoroseomonas alba]MBW6400461.1 SDR family oxidoreductase [Neoroseomonas alba]
MTAAPTRTAIVTGAARGIGRAIALSLAQQGHAIALVDLREKDLAQTAQEVAALGVDAMPIMADTSDYEAARRHVADVAARWGRIDVLVNNAAVPQPRRILEITEAEWDSGMAVNLKGYFNWSQAVAPVMLAAGGGRMINISSVSANTGPRIFSVSRFAYSTAKAGILGMTRALARELAPTIVVNAVCPGAIETERTRANLGTHLDHVIRETPLARLGTAEDIAVVVTFLATATPMYMTGEVIDVDGGANIN